MSAFLCTSDTFDAIVTAWDHLSYGNQFYDRDRWCNKFPVADQEELGCLQLLRQMLIKANLRSLHYRYGPGTGSNNTEALAEFSEGEQKLLNTKFDAIGQITEQLSQLKFGPIIHIIACYDYQSQEPGDWHQSDAYLFLQDIKGLILNRLRDTTPADIKPAYGSYERPAGNPGPKSLTLMAGLRK